MAITKIKDSDYANKGIRVKNNPLGLSVSEAQRAFDELPLDVIIPAVNRMAGEIDTTVSELQNKDTTNSTAIAKNTADISTNKSDISKNKTDISQNKTDITELKKRVSTTETDISTNKSDISKNKTDISQNKTDITDIKGKVSALQIDISQKAEKDNVLSKDNTEIFVPAENYNPATKKYVDDLISTSGGGDMLKTVYDKQNKGLDIYEYADKHIDNKNNPHGVTAKQLGALTDESLTKEKILTKIDVLDIAHGGTGKATKKEAFTNLAFLGNNPISATSEDTPQKWGELGNGYAKFDTANLMINQPYTYMFVINLHDSGSGNIFQIGSEQKSGTVYYRSGNSSGWHMNWTPLLSTKGGTMSGALLMNGNGIVFNKDADWDNGNYFSINAENDSIKLQMRRNKLNRLFYFNDNATTIDKALQMWWYDDGKEHSSRFFGEHNTSLLATTIQNLLKGGSISVVKSIQKGTLQLSGSPEIITTYESGDGYSSVKYFYKDITISPVDVTKSVVFFNSPPNARESYTCRLVNSTTLRIYLDSTNDSSVTSKTMYYYYRTTWQVVEFY